MRLAAPCLGAVTLLLAHSASADEPGVPVTIRVVDSHGQPVPTASIRSPLDRERHSVNASNGEWRESVLYLPRGEELPFEPGMVAQFQVNAPGYASRWVEFEVGPWRNLVVVNLENMGKARACDSKPLSRACRRAPADHGPSVVYAEPSPDFELTPDVLRELGELRQASPELSAKFSQHLLAMGPDYADQAMFWADLAADEANILQGDAYVAVMHDVYEVRAKAANVQWQAAQYAWLDSDVEWQRRHDAEVARRRAALIADDWAEWADASGEEAALAEALCLSAADSPGRCR